MAEVRTRFAPSPTGFQHLGGFRTAFFAWLLAKRHGGQFLLRIEDTDRERTVPGAIRFILEELAWFGIQPDEGPSKAELEQIGESWEGAPDIGGAHGPYIQSLRMKRYKEVAEELIARGFAYRCDCTPEMLERERNEQMARKELPGYSGYCRTRSVSPDVPHVVRLKIPQKRAISFNDGVRGKVTWDQIQLRDTVLLKSDGSPTYHLAVVVDDHDMKISHVLRGVEWLSSTPIHLLVYEALGWEPPVIAHFPVINGPDGKKLSKRTGAATSREAREKGFLPEAVLNFVSLIGWAPGEGSDQEIFTREELIRQFSLEGINPASGVFDMTKMEWMNGLYIRKLETKDFIDRAMPFLKAAGVEVPVTMFAEIAPHVQERVKLLTEVPGMIEFLMDKPLDRQMDAMFQKGIDATKAADILRRSKVVLEQLGDFSVTQIDQALRGVATELGLKPGPAFGVLRVAVTGKTITPPLFESFAVLGRDRVVSRIAEALNLL
ncbi:MAG: glutamate--tRNA ligase [Pseudomonadota bacterium]|jgi:glutamyl-tRNA synthetase